ncbi:hypothetical protein [Pedobacter endophyticus]|uniref:Uncharacterized protein n=1 Tax=Pedobacter endophyticus TaxID=2789740 RepID=A0A7S9PYK9_9SPHI|nr:hypothetical protein [Pedobacter endophyticus]QPH39443.1 hypothetical protein IZT61_20765 [Pedobacter endophyticus]
MELTKESQLYIYKSINFYNRYKLLSESFRFENTFESYSKNEVLNILNEIGYNAKYHKKENFFEIEEIISDKKFYLNTCLKYGLVELIIGVSDVKTDALIMGGVFGNISDEIEYLAGINNERKIFLPSFRDYNDLKIILTEAFNLYEDFKHEFIIYGQYNN